MYYNFVSFSQIDHKRKKLEYITLFMLIYCIPEYAGIMYFKVTEGIR